MVNLKALEAAELITQAYAGKIDGQVDKIINDRAEGYLRDDGLLVIPGSQGVRDYTKFNLRVITWKNLNSKSKIKFHAGFLKHALLLHEFAKKNNVKMITGHSLGAASSQLLASILDVPALNFAAPRVLVKGFRAVHGTKVININRNDDTIGKIPRFFYKHIGELHELDPQENNRESDHAMKHYVRAMKMAHVQDASPIRFA